MGRAGEEGGGRREERGERREVIEKSDNVSQTYRRREGEREGGRAPSTETGTIGRERGGRECGGI